MIPPTTLFVSARERNVDEDMNSSFTLGSFGLSESVEDHGFDISRISLPPYRIGVLNG